MNIKCKFFVAAMGISAAVTASAQLVSSTIPDPIVPTERHPRFTVPQVPKAPIIDGKLDDACWKEAFKACGFYRFQSNDPIHEQTEAWICADRSNIYVAFHCIDRHPELIRAHETQREGDVSHDDVAVFVIDSQGTRRNVSQFTVTPRGTQQTQLEGGTADNLSWAGDWKGAAQRTSDGWTAEMAIPFSLLRYPKGTHSFPMAFLRGLARETNPEIWPYIPPEGFNNPLPYTADFSGFDPPTFSPKPLFLPYTLASTGDRTTFRSGLDIKYPVSTTLTGVATIFPDFTTVEDAVQNLSFSYTEKYVPDRRPFFAEGNGFWPDPFLFYSQRIPSVDGGMFLFAARCKSKHPGHGYANPDYPQWIVSPESSGDHRWPVGSAGQ